MSWFQRVIDDRYSSALCHVVIVPISHEIEFCHQRGTKVTACENEGGNPTGNGTIQLVYEDGFRTALPAKLHRNDR